ncbi:MAG: hypothetical protein ACFFHD_00190 [Promethearchaeota archaeon]
MLIRSRIKYKNLYLRDINWIDPKKLIYVSGLRFNKWQNYLRIIDGDWDLHEKRFEDTMFYKAFNQRFIENQPWENTFYYQWGLKLINEKNDERRNYFLRKWDDRFRRLENLYFNIKRYGIKNKKDFLYRKDWFIRIEATALLDNISVDIGRNGQLLTGHGKHRLSIAKILNLPLVPVTIIARHKNWMDFRAKLIHHLKLHQNGKEKYDFLHPDLKKIPFKQGRIPYDILVDKIKEKRGISL